MQVKYSNNQDVDFIHLVKLLDEEYVRIYGEIAKKYRPYNSLEAITQAILLYDQNKPVACGSYKEFDKKTVELKRIFVSEKYRGKGIGKQIVSLLENSALKKGYCFAVLETGADMQPAICLYKKMGYQIINNFGPYIQDSLCICMHKKLN